MSVLTAAETVLKGAGRPLHYEELTRRMLESGLWKTTGKTPEATVRGALGVDIRRRGTGSRFLRTDRGMFALRDWGQSEHQKSQEALQKPDAMSTKRVSFNDVTEQVLERFGSKEPMHYQDITERALTLGLLTTTGKTPAATLYAQVIQGSSGRRDEENGPASCSTERDISASQNGWPQAWPSRSIGITNKRRKDSSSRSEEWTLETLKS